MRYNEIVSQEEEIWRNIAIAKTNYCKTNLEELFIDLIIHGSYLLQNFRSKIRSKRN